MEDVILNEAAISRSEVASAVEGSLSPARMLPSTVYNPNMERKIFWLVFIVLGLLADLLLPLWWALFATIPIVFISWWVAYRSGWFE